MNLATMQLKSLGPYFGIPEAASLTAVPVRLASICATRIDKNTEAGTKPVVSLPACDAYFLMLYLDDASHSDILSDGTWATPRRPERGSVCLVDLCDGAAIVLHASLRSLAFLLPKALIEEVRALSPARSTCKVRCRRGEPDFVLANLGNIVLSLFDGNAGASHAMLRHLAIAICAHLIDDCATPSQADDAVLPYGREAAAKEFMRKNLSRELAVAEIAAAAGLSANHFSQGFKKVTGFAPHQWLMRARVDAAKDMLGSGDMTLKAIANACGFVDQSHFTKVFSREMGVTPAVWRDRQIH